MGLDLSRRGTLFADVRLFFLWGVREDAGVAEVGAGVVLAVEFGRLLSRYPRGAKGTIAEGVNIMVGDWSVSPCIPPEGLIIIVADPCGFSACARSFSCWGSAPGSQTSVPASTGPVSVRSQGKSSVVFHPDAP